MGSGQPRPSAAGTVFSWLILLVPVLAITAAVHSQVVDPEIRVVDDDAPRTPCPGGLPQGRCWENAVTDLQEALNAASDPELGITEIWVAVHSAGGYVPSEVNDPGGGPDLRRATYLLQDELAVYGGFLGNALGIGNGETSRSQRNPEVNETVLTGEFLDVPSGCPDPSCFERPGPCTQCQECRDLVCAAFPLCCANGWDADVGQCAQAAHDLCEKSFNAYHVVTAEGLTDTARLEGFTITDGLADGNGYIDFLEPSANGYFTDEVSGGGILIDGSSVSQPTTGPIIARCRMVDDAAIFGGGLATQGAADPAISPILVNLEFLDNTAFSEGPELPIEPGIGGGAWSGPTSRELWMNCLFARNWADDHGAGLFMETGTELNITNCTFADNLANADADGAGKGGGLYLREENPVPAGGPTLTQIANGIFFHNGDSTGTGPSAQIHVEAFDGLDVTLRHSDVKDSMPPYVINGGGNIHESPRFVGAGNYRLQGTSPCIDIGCNTALPPDLANLDEDQDVLEPTPFDLDMNARMQLGDPGDASGVDMGAYEFGGSFCPWDCQSAPSGTVDVMDFLAMLGRWGQECVQCDFGVGAPGVGIEEFLDLLQWWGTCPLSSAPPPETIEEVVEDAGLDYPQDWNEFVGVMIDPEVSEAVKANYRCWMDHYLDCHRRPFCSECVWCQICPDSDPYGNHP